MKRTLHVVALAGALSAPGCLTEPREGVDEKFNFWPIAHYETTEDPPGFSADVLWPLFHRERLGNATASRLLPLWFAKSDGVDKSELDVLLLYYQERDEGRPSMRRILFPFFWWLRSPAVEQTDVWPLYGTRTTGIGADPKRRDFFLWPLARYERTASGDQQDFGAIDLGELFQLYATESRAPADGVATRQTNFVRALDSAFWLYHSESKGAGNVPGTGPSSEGSLVNVLQILQLADWKTRPNGTHRARVLGLLDEDELGLFASSGDGAADGERTRAHLFPLYWSRSAPGERSFLLLPLFGRASTDAGYARTWLLPPLLGLESDPTKDLTGTDVLWPLVRYASEGTGDERVRHFRLLPLLWFDVRPDTHANVVFPFYWDIGDANNRYVHFVPLYGHHSEDGGLRTRSFFLPPLLVATEDKGEQIHRTDVLWPLLRFESSADGALNYAIPLFWHRERGARSHLNVLGLFDRDRSEVATRTMLWPLWSATDAAGEGRRTSWLPALDVRYLADEAPQGSTTSFLFPLADFSRAEGGFRRWLFPFFWWADDGVQSSHFHIWPLFGVNEKAGVRTYSTLFPFFFRGSNDDGTVGKSGFLFPFGGSTRDASEARHWLFPLFYHSSIAEAEQGSEGPAASEDFTWVLWPLFSRTVKSDGSSRWHSLFELLRSEQDANASQFSVLHSLFRTRTEGARTTQSVAFLYHYENDAGARTLKLFHLIPIRW